jgi:hypothetical protein
VGLPLNSSSKATLLKDLYFDISIPMICSFAGVVRSEYVAKFNENLKRVLDWVKENGLKFDQQKPSDTLDKKICNLCLNLNTGPVFKLRAFV